ncbi:hypothetical protein FPZ54_10620 [Sphingomonas suaedae]|uniref:Tetratricopeptide repeat protein n=1 Tax=Sphingomonas suaedae TaxID=2599297 RepID=A0A518RG48_9SPHN|nr:hypothetical protein [Sphingomonas suaedae]QDX26432.1 hypothetical protein FPZ54_10620 [Sphingomonas suaedae]
MRVLAHIVIMLFAALIVAPPTWAQEIKFDENDPEIARSLAAYRNSTEEWDAGELSRAGELAREALSIRRAKLGDTHRLTIHALERVALLASEQKQFGEAIELIGQAVAARRVDPDPIYLATAYFSQYRILSSAGQDAEAETALRQAIALAAIHEPEHNRARLLANWGYHLGKLLFMARRDAEALPYYDAYLALEDDGSDAAARRLAWSILNRSIMISKFGRQREAIESLERLLLAIDPRLEENSELLDRARGAFAAAAIALGEPARVRDLYERNLAEVRARSPGGEEEAGALESLAGALDMIGLGEQALENYIEAIELNLAITGRRRFIVINEASKQALGLGLINKAEELSRVGLKAAEAAQNPLLIARASISLSVLLRKLGRYGEALAYTKQASRLLEQHRLDDPTSVANIALQRADIALETGEGNAEQHALIALAIWQKLEGDYYRPNTAVTHHLLGEAYARQNRFREGVEQFDLCAETFNRTAESFQINILTCLSKAAEATGNAGDIEGARARFAAVGSLFPTSLGPTDPIRITETARAGQFFLRAGEPETARRLLADAGLRANELTARSAVDANAQRLARSYRNIFTKLVSANWQLSRMRD